MFSAKHGIPREVIHWLLRSRKNEVEKSLLMDCVIKLNICLTVCCFSEYSGVWTLPISLSYR